MTIIKFKGKLYRKLSDVITEHNLDKTSLNIYSKKHNISTYQILTKIDKEIIDSKIFTSKSIRTMEIKKKENLAVLKLCSNKPFIVNDIEYDSIEDVIVSEKIPIQKLIRKGKLNEFKNMEEIVESFINI